MGDDRVLKAKKNIVISLICQVLNLICGIIVPRLFINAYGSEVYGASASITQFLAYIALLEGGVGGVARAALYKPLSIDDKNEIGAIMHEVKRFFRIIGFIFLVYVAILSCTFQKISDIQCMDWNSTFWLVIAISISTFGQYFLGISYSILLNASQRQYIVNVINIGTMIANTLLIIVLVNWGCNIVLVKFVSSFIFLMRPILMISYVNRKFAIPRQINKNTEALNQKWVGLSQHIAYFLHSNAAIVVLTVFGNLTLVAVYSVYRMVITSIQSITQSFAAGMEAFFGDMLAKNEKGLLMKMFNYYETLISGSSMVLFGTTAAMIVPFVKLYTREITDANYIVPTFALILTISALLDCLRMPYHDLVYAAGHFKETRMAAYGEAAINVLVSILMVVNFGLVGVAIGTVTAIAFRFLFYVVYLSKFICHRSPKLFVKRLAINSLNFATIVFLGNLINHMILVQTYVDWVIVSAIVGIMALFVTIALNTIFYKDDVSVVLEKITARIRKRGGV